MTSSNVVLDEARLVEAVEYFRTQPGFSFDVESQGEHRGVCHLADTTWMSMSTRGSTIVIPFGHPIGTKVLGTHKERRQYGGEGPRAGTYYNATVVDYEPPPRQIPRDNVFEIVRPLFFDEGIVKSAHGAVYDIATSAKYFGEVIPGPYNDTIIQAWLLDDNRKRNGLKYLTKEIYGFEYDDENVGKCIEKYPFDLVAHYSYCDGIYAEMLRNRFTPQIIQQNLTGVYELEMEVLNVVVGMRLAGSRVDVERLKELRVDLTERKDYKTKEVMKNAGRIFNLNSPQQKQAVLFGDEDEGGQGLKPWKATDTGKKQKKLGQPVTNWSTDDEVLASYPTNGVASSLREYQELNKLLGTYVLAYLGNPEKDRPTQIYDDRIYADFVQYGTNTRRFSCRDPNLQNIPRPDKELGKLIRGAWQADPGWKLIVGDYGQIELVMFAHFAGRGPLFEGFKNGIDPHQVTGDKLNIDRQLGKRLNFSMGFGAGLYLVASMLGVDVDLARSILDDHQREFPEIYELKEQIIETCSSRDPHYVKTLMGGMRRLTDINSPVKGLRERAERQAVSAVIQGSAADLIKMALVRTDSHPDLGDDAHIILTVHDEIVLTAPEDQAENVAQVLRDAMLGPGIQKLIKVPLTADIKIVDRWAEAK